MTNIRTATPADLPDILEMVRALSAFHGDEARVTPEALKNIFFGTQPTALGMIATLQDKTVGYIGLTPTTVIHEGTIWFDIHHMFVKDTARAQGIGTALIAAAKAHAQSCGATRLTIGTDPRNEVAIAAYRAMPALQEISGAGPRFRVDLTV